METEKTITPTLKEPKTKRSIGKPLIILLILILMAASSAAGYFYRERKAKQQIATVQSQLKQSTDQLEAAKKEVTELKTTDKTETTVAVSVPSQSLIDNIKDVFASGNSAALEGYMANPVTVIVAASEGLGSKTPEQATLDVTNWMKNATDPWNFSLPASTLSAWRNGDYKQYFPSNAVIGKTDNMVIAFSFNAANKISTVFMSNSVDVLTN